MRICPKCGFQIENDRAKFCKKCGSPLPAIENEVDSKPIHLKENEEIYANSQHKAMRPTQAEEIPAIKEEKEANVEENTNSTQESLKCEEVDHVGGTKGNNSDSNETHQYTSKWLKENTNIHGWLSFFLFAIALGGLISAISSVTTYDAEDYAGSIWLGSIDIFLGFGLLAIAVYTIYAFCQRKSNAVFYGRLYVIFVFVTNIISVIGSDGTGSKEIMQAVRGIIWGIVWFFYLLLSNQVQVIIPETFRKVNKIDWCVLASLVTIPIICFVIGFSSINSDAENRENQEKEVMEVPLAEDERTDGRIIFTIPATFECQSKEVEVGTDSKLTVFTLQNETIGNSVICSDYDTDMSTGNFNEYWTNWENEEDKELPKKEIAEGDKEINGNKCLYKIVCYKVKGVRVYWRFHILFDEESGKCCIVSCYDRDESTDYVNDILNSIRFK